MAKKIRKQKFAQYHSTLSSVLGDGFSELESLGEEMRESFDNLSEGLQQTNRNQTVDETASTLEGLNEPDCPDSLAELRVDYTEQVKKRPSRATRRDNAVCMLRGCAEALEKWIAEAEASIEQDKATDDNDEDTTLDDARTLLDEINDLCDEAEGCDFPGMYG